jgi:lambda family phage tail tape measure protein
VRAQTVETVSQLVSELEALASANPQAFGDEAQAQIARYKQALVETSIVADSMAVRINTEVSNGFGNFFQDVISGTETVEGAFKKMLANITSAIAQEATRALGQQLFRSIFGATAGGDAGGIGGFFSGLLGFAEGGYTGDGGKYQPKGIVHGGEFVFNKQATSNLGLKTLEHIHNMASGGFLPRSPRRSYADGGLVDLPAGAAPGMQNITNVVAIDQADVQNAAFGGGADKKILNIVNVNRASFRAALGV